jgi:hypothetical protein
MTDPIYSEQTLAELALRKLMAVANGQSATADDAKLVTDKIEGLLNDLSVRRMYSAQSVEAISPGAFDYVATCLAYRCNLEFGITGVELQLLRDAKNDAESKLRTLAFSLQPAPVMAFDPILRGGPRRLW